LFGFIYLTVSRTMQSLLSYFNLNSVRNTKSQNQNPFILNEINHVEQHSNTYRYSCPVGRLAWTVSSLVCYWTSYIRNLVSGEQPLTDLLCHHFKLREIRTRVSANTKGDLESATSNAHP